MKNEIVEAIRKIANNEFTPYSIVCEVESVNLIDKTCYCIPVNGDADLQNVRLNADKKDGFILIPKQNSLVVVSFINDSTAYISMVSEVDEINLNGTSFDGIVKVNDLVTKLNNLENKVNTIISTFNSHTHVASSFGSPTTVPPVLVTGTLTPTVKTDLENEKIKHG
jgi:hypothetical protein